MGNTISDELKENIEQLGSYYRQHKIAKMVKTHPGFVGDDFSKLLAKLHIELGIGK